MTSSSSSPPPPPVERELESVVVLDAVVARAGVDDAAPGAASADAERPPPSPPIFSAPHGVFLHRASALKVPEEWTSFLAEEFARACDGVAIAWSKDERVRSRAARDAVPGRIDPNCCDPASDASHPFGVLLRRHAAAHPGALHVDVHGRRDPEGDALVDIGRGDVDVGTGALRGASDDERSRAFAERVRRAVSRRLRAFLATTWGGRRRRRRVRGERRSGARGRARGRHAHDVAARRGARFSQRAARAEFASAKRVARRRRRDARLRARGARRVGGVPKRGVSARRDCASVLMHVEVQ